MEAALLELSTKVLGKALLVIADRVIEAIFIRISIRLAILTSRSIAGLFCAVAVVLSVNSNSSFLSLMTLRNLITLPLICLILPPFGFAGDWTRRHTLFGILLFIDNFVVFSSFHCLLLFISSGVTTWWLDFFFHIFWYQISQRTAQILACISLAILSVLFGVFTGLYLDFILPWNVEDAHRHFTHLLGLLEQRKRRQAQLQRLRENVSMLKILNASEVKLAHSQDYWAVITERLLPKIGVYRSENVTNVGLPSPGTASFQPQCVDVVSTVRNQKIGLTFSGNDFEFLGAKGKVPEFSVERPENLCAAFYISLLILKNASLLPRAKDILHNILHCLSHFPVSATLRLPEYEKVEFGLAFAYGSLGDFDKALEYATKALERTRQAKGEHHADTIDILQYVGDLGYARNSYQDAEDNHLTAWVISHFEFGPCHVRTLSAMCALAHTLLAQSRRKHALQLLRQLYISAIAERRHNSGSSSEKRILEKLKECLDKTAHQGECPRLWHTMFNDRSRTIDVDMSRFLSVNIWTMGDHIEFLENSRSCSIAYSVCEKILAERRGALGHHHEQTLTTVRTLIRLMVQRGEFDLALQLCNENLDLTRKNRKRNATVMEMNTISCDLALVLEAKGERHTAETLAQEIVFPKSTKASWDEYLYIANFKRLSSARLNRQIIGENSPQNLNYPKDLGLTHWIFNDVNPPPFDYLRNLGRGSLAIVTKIRHSERHDIVFAKKSFDLRHKYKAALIDRIYKEILIVERLSHPHLVHVVCSYEYKTEFAVLFYPAAEFDLERFLEGVLEFNGPLSPNVRKMLSRFFLCIVKTLKFIHENFVRHKDIKTSNFLVKDEFVYFTDFGSSREFDHEYSSSSYGSPYGYTPAYLAPEVFTGTARGKSADIFSLGCVFSEMASVLHGKSLKSFHDFRAVDDPFGTSGISHAFHKNLDNLDAWFQGDVNSEYSAFIKPMLARDKTNRPTTAQTIIDIQNFYDQDTLHCDQCHLIRDEILLE